MHNDNNYPAIISSLTHRLSAALRCLLLALPILLAASCSDNPRGAETMSQARQVISENPDSALAILRSVSSEADGFPNSQRMAYYLLLADAKNKAYADMSADSIMHEVADYYDTWGDSNERMQSLYLLGCVYRDRGDSPAALRYYNDAVHCADTTAKECDYSTLASLYGQISTLYHDLHLYEKDIEYERKAVKASLMAGDTIKAIKYYEHLAPIYNILNQYDSVAFIAKKASELYKKHAGKDISSQAKTLYISTLIKSGDLIEAKELMDEYENTYGIYDSTGKIKNNHKGYFSIKTDYYLKAEKLDSAMIYANELCTYSNDKKILLLAYRRKMKIHEKLNELSDALKFAEIYNLLNDSTHNIEVSDNFSRMQAMYNYSHHVKVAAEKTVEAKYNRIMYIFAIAAGIITCIILVLSYRRKNKKMKQQQDEERKIALAKYMTAVEELNQMKEDYENYIKRKTSELSMLRKKISLPDGLNNNIMLNDMQNNMYNEIIKDLNKKVNSLTELSGSDIAILHHKSKQIFPKFYTRIDAQEYELTQQEKNVCLLIKLHFTPSDICILLNAHKQRISNIRANINRKIFGKKSSAGVDRNLRDI